MAYRELSFCRECGAVWSAGASVCGACGTPRASSAARPAATGMSTGAGLVSSLALYAVLLVTVLAPLVLESVDLFEMIEGILIVDTIAVAIWAVVHRRDLGPALRRIGEFEHWMIVLAAVPITVAIAEANLWFATEVVGGLDVDLIAMMFAGGYSLPLVLLMCAVQPGIVEELAFRGIMFERLSAIVDPPAAIVIAALAFMVLHLALLSFVFLIVLGLLAGWLRWKSGSLYPAIALHLLHNAAIVLLAWM